MDDSRPKAKLEALTGFRFIAAALILVITRPYFVSRYPPMILDTASPSSFVFSVGAGRYRAF